MKKAIFSYSFSGFAYNFTKEIIEEYIKCEYMVYVIIPDKEYIEELEKLGCIIIKAPIDRRSKNIIRDYKLYNFYKKTFKEIKPNIIFGFSIKPNIYGAQAAKKFKIPFVARISGLGTAFQKKNTLYYITKYLYKFSFSKISYIYFENKLNSENFQKIVGKFPNSKVISGSGVNTENFPYLKFPEKNVPIKFLFVGRIMVEKGFREYLSLAKKMKEKYGKKIEFHIIGEYEEDFKEEVNYLNDNNIIIYYGKVKNVSDYISKSHCIILPSYHEGMSNALLEAQSSGRAVIGSDIPGIRETFIDNVSGFLFKVKDQNELNDVTDKFFNLPYEDKVKMGKEGRKHISEKFNRNTIVKEYIGRDKYEENFTCNK